MKKFMEEYGLIVVAAIIIMIFVLVATPIGTSLKNGVKTMVDKITDSMVTEPEEDGGVAGEISPDEAEALAVFGCAKVGDTYQIRWKFGNKIMSQNIIDGKSDNGGMDGGSYQLLDTEPTNKGSIASGVFYKSFLDDVCPLHYNGSYRGGGHGEDSTYNINVENHGLTDADVGSVWKDASNHDYVVFRIVDDNVFSVISDFTGNDRSPVYKGTPSSPLIHVSGATHSENIVFDSITRKMMHPDFNNRTFVVRDSDGNALTEDGWYQSDYIDITENYHILNLKDMLVKLKTNVGKNTSTSFYADDVSADFDYQQTYRFFPNGVCLLHTKATPMREGIYLDYFGGTQATPMGAVQHIPFTTDYSGLYKMQDGEVVSLSPDKWSNEDIPPYKLVQFREDYGGKYGFELGYCIDYGSAKPEIRKTQELSGTVFSSKKMYPYLYGMPDSHPDIYGTTLEAYVFRAPIDKSNGYTCITYPIGDALYAEIELYDQFDGDINLFGVGNRKTVQVLACDGISYENKIDNKSIHISGSAYDSITLKIK